MYVVDLNASLYIIRMNNYVTAMCIYIRDKSALVKCIQLQTIKTLESFYL